MTRSDQITDADVDLAIEYVYSQVFFMVPGVDFDDTDRILESLDHIVGHVAENATSQQVARVRAQFLELILDEKNVEAHEFLIDHLKKLQVTVEEVRELQEKYPQRDKVPGCDIAEILDDLQGVVRLEPPPFILPLHEQEKQQELLQEWDRLTDI